MKLSIIPEAFGKFPCFSSLFSTFLLSCLWIANEQPLWRSDPENPSVLQANFSKWLSIIFIGLEFLSNMGKNDLLIISILWSTPGRSIFVICWNRRKSAGSKVQGRFVEARNSTWSDRDSRPSSWTRNSALHLKITRFCVWFWDYLFFHIPFWGFMLTAHSPVSQESLSLIKENNRGCIGSCKLKDMSDKFLRVSSPFAGHAAGMNIKKCGTSCASQCSC